MDYHVQDGHEFDPVPNISSSPGGRACNLKLKCTDDALCRGRGRGDRSSRAEVPITYSTPEPP